MPAGLLSGGKGRPWPRGPGRRLGALPRPWQGKPDKFDGESRLRPAITAHGVPGEGSPVKEAGKEGEETLGEFEEVVPQEKILQKTSDIKEQDSVEQPVEPDTEELFVKESREGTEEVEEEDNSEDDNSVEETEKQRIEKETGRL